MTGTSAIVKTKDSEPKFTPKRGRPNRQQAAAIEVVILDVARAEFLKNGYASTAMETVAALAGISKGTLYSRYDSKPALFRAIVSDRLENWTQQAPKTLSNNVALPELLFEFGLGFIEQISQPEQAAFGKLVTAEADTFPELAKEFHEQGLQPAVHQLGLRIAEACAKSKSPPVDPDSVADLFISCLLGWYARNEATGGKGRPDTAVSRLVAVIIGGSAAW